MSLNEVSQVVGLVGSVTTFIGIIFIIYKQFADPDIKAANKIGLLEQGCKLTHANLNERFDNINSNIDNINKSFMLLKENDMKHIENSVRSLEEGQIKMLTIMEERFPKK